MIHLAKYKLSQEVNKRKIKKGIFVGGCKQKVQHALNQNSGLIIIGGTTGAWDEKTNKLIMAIKQGLKVTKNKDFNSVVMCYSFNIRGTFLLGCWASCEEGMLRGKQVFV